MWGTTVFHGQQSEQSGWLDSVARFSSGGSLRPPVPDSPKGDSCLCRCPLFCLSVPTAGIFGFIYGVAATSLVRSPVPVPHLVTDEGRTFLERIREIGLE